MQKNKSRYASYVNPPLPSSLPRPIFLDENLVVGENHKTIITHNKIFRAIRGGSEVVVVDGNTKP